MAVVIKDQIPIVKNADGVILVGGTRVPLDTVIYHFKQGAAAEDIAKWYTTLDLSDVYYVIGYYLKNTSEIESYLGERARVKQKVRKMVEARSNLRELRKKILARQSALDENK